MRTGLIHLQSYRQLAWEAATAGEFLVLILSRFSSIPDLKCFPLFLGVLRCIMSIMRLAWQIRPKHHVFHHLCLDQRDQKYNARFFHAFRDEAAMRFSKRASTSIQDCWPRTN